MTDEKEEQIQQSWQANAEAWTRAIDNDEIESRRLVTNDAIIAAVLRYDVRRVLDVGCGEGWLVRALAEQGVDGFGIDASDQLIDRARRRGGGRFDVVDYEQIVSNPGVLGPPFDGVVCNFSLLGEQISPILAALKKNSTAEGHLFIQTVHPFTARGEERYEDGWRTETFDSFGGAFREPMPWYFRTISSWFEQVSAAGLHLVECEEPVHPQTKVPLSLLLICR